MASISRIESFWSIMVSMMQFPHYATPDIKNSRGDYAAREKSDTWTIVRNIVLNAVHHLKIAAAFLGEMIRYKLKEDADMIFDYTLQREFGNTDLSGNPIIKLYRRTLHDYKEEIDCIVDEFIAVASVVPRDQAQMLDRASCDRTIRVGRMNENLFKEQSKNAKSPSNKCNSDEEKEEKSIQSKSKQITNLHVDVDKLCFKTIILDSCKPPISAVLGGLHEDATQDEVSLPYTFWTNIKQVTTRDIHQKFLTLVMTPVRQNDDAARLSNAIQFGVTSRQVDKLMKQLADKTGVDFLILQDLVEQNNSVTLCKPINTMSDEDVMRLYGTDREQLTQLKYQKQKELETFIVVRKEIVQTINNVSTKNIKQIDIIPEDQTDDDIKYDNESLNEMDHVDKEDVEAKDVDLTDNIATDKKKSSASQWGINLLSLG